MSLLLLYKWFCVYGPADLCAGGGVPSKYCIKYACAMRCARTSCLTSCFYAYSMPRGAAYLKGVCIHLSMIKVACCYVLCYCVHRHNSYCWYQCMYICDYHHIAVAEHFALQCFHCYCCSCVRNSCGNVVSHFWFRLRAYFCGCKVQT